MSNDSKSVYNRSAKGLPGSEPGLVDFMAIITGYAANGSNKWKYSFRQVNDDFTEMTNPLQEALDGNYALNDFEYINSASGVLGIGIHTDDLDDAAATATLQPIPVGLPVVMRRRQSKAGNIIYRFAAPNGLTVGCKT